MSLKLLPRGTSARGANKINVLRGKFKIVSNHLFAGAIGSYKNPHSHRTLNLSDPREAQEQVMLATYLLRIVDTRRP
jgi:Protein of unknown function (Hypoth_ymh)